MPESTFAALGKVHLQGVADAVGAHYLHPKNDAEIDTVIATALHRSPDRGPIIVDVNIDYSKPTRFTRGGGQSGLRPAPLGEKAPLIGRALWRKVSG